MDIKNLYKRQGGQTLVVTGHFNAKELRHLKREGYHWHEPQVNRNGIPVGRKRA